MTRAKDISKIVTDADFSGTLDVTGTVTAGALAVDGTNVVTADLDTTNSNADITLDNVSYGVRLRTTSAGGFSVMPADTTYLNVALNGDISFYEDTGTTPKFLWDASTERLAIGVSSPAATLHIGDSDTAVNGTMRFGQNSTYYGFIQKVYGTDKFDIGTNGAGQHISFTNNGTERMRIDSNGNVGIGTTSIGSSDRLSINGGRVRIVNSVAQSGNTLDNSTFSGLIVNNSNDANGDLAGIAMYPTSQYTAAAGVFGYRESQTAGGLSFWTGSNTGSERMRIRSDGRIGVNTSSVDAEMHIEPKSGGTNASILLSNDGRTQYFRIQNQETNDALTINANDTNERMRIDSSGNIGIGTSSPADRFHVKLSSGQRVARFESSDSTSAHIAFKAPNTSLMPTVGVKDEAFYISTNDAVERMRITDSGIVAFNNSDTLGTYAFWLSDAKNSSSSTPCANNGITIVNNEGHPSANDFHHGITFAGHYTAPNRTRAGIFFQSTAANHTGAAFIIATRGAADASELTFADQKVKIGADGNFQATDTSISSLSDERLKQNIEDFTYDIEKFKKYKPKTFQWKMPEFHGGTVKEDSSVDQFTQRGFVAQDIESIDDYWLAVDTMNPDHPEYDYVKDDPNVKTSKLGKKDAMYVSVIQQLLTKIEALETAKTDLEARITALEGA